MPMFAYAGQICACVHALDESEDMMAETATIVVDAMGGDNAPGVVLEGVAQALVEDKDLQVILCGPADIVGPFSAEHERCGAQAASEVIAMGEHPARAVRQKKDSSIVVGCKLVKEGKADGFFSAGSTGACLAAATLVMGRIKGVSRPALATVVPSPVRPIIMCDVGANADCKPEYLVQFAQMGSIYAKRILGIESPKCALLNIGSEDTKGSQFAQDSFKLMQRKLDNFAGNAEGGDILNATYDVIVSDGFTGNVCLKTIEGTSRALFGAIKDSLMSSTVAKLGALAIKGSLKNLKDSVSPDTYGGAPLLGVKGACIVGHGSSNATAIKNGILISAKSAKLHITDEIEQAIASTKSDGILGAVGTVAEQAENLKNSFAGGDGVDA